MNTPTQSCEHCGAPLPIGARFCEACGQPVKRQPAAPAPQPPPSYQASLPAAPQTPPAYQASLPATPPPPAPARPVQSQPFTLPPTPAAPLIAEKPKNKWILPACLGGGCLLVACLVAVAILYFFFSSAEWDAVLETVQPAILETQNAAVATVVQEEFVPATLPAGIITATAVPLPNRQGSPTQAPLATPIQPPTEVPQVNVSAVIWPADIGQQLTDTYFSDDFSAPAFVEWDGGEAGISTWEIIDGRYQGFLYTKDYMSWVYLPLEFTPTTIGFDAAIVPGYEQGGYGVLCHYTDANHFYFVSLDPWYHEYSIGFFENDEFYELMQEMWLESTTLLDDPYAVNHVEVVCDPDLITLFVNNQLEAQVEIPRTEGGQTGIYVETWTDTPDEGFKALFDNLYAYIPVQ